MVSTHYRIKKEIAWRKMRDGTMTLISPLDDSILTVNGTAARIVELLAEELSIDEIAERIQKETSHKDADEVKNDTSEFIQTLLDKGFLSH